MTTTLSILILAIAAICLGRRLLRKQSRAPAGNASPSLPILTDEEMERMLEENDRVYEQLMSDGRAMQAMFASQEAQLAKEATPKAAKPTSPKCRNHTANSGEPRKRRKLRTQVSTSKPTQQQVPQQNPVQSNPSQQNASQSAPQLTTLPPIQSRPPAVTWFSRFVAPIQRAARRLYLFAGHAVLMQLRIRSWVFRPEPPENLPQEPSQRRAA